ncbi:MAG: hypothetical protein E7612_02340 [Ruminococcaceae bacterium]|nr:hypothetical protein [Oscillospiraceae bacterium]
MSDTDLSKIIGLIMENPKLIEEIKNLASKENKEETEPIDEIKEKAANEAIKTNTEAEVPIENSSRIKRRELLCALKPYVSESRGKAIDSMMSIADILDMMRSN